MIENIGYITIYLFIRWTITPIPKSVHRAYGATVGKKLSKIVNILLWPFIIPAYLIFIWADGVFNLGEEN